MADHQADFDVVTGAFGYTGRYVTRRLLDQGRRVVTLTSRSQADSPFGDAVTAYPLDFANPGTLVDVLRGARVLINSYWIRFARGKTTFAGAVANSRALIGAAREASVGRIVHTSICKPSLDSPLPYYSGKAQVEQAIRESGSSYAILRPTVIFGDEDILINNIAWIARRFPLFAVPGDGKYRLQPIFVEEYADMVVEAAGSNDTYIRDAVGPETFTFDELVRAVGAAIGKRVRLWHLPPGLALFLSRIIGLFVGDVVLTREEVEGLMADLLASDEEPTGKTRLTDWLAEHADTVGKRYHSEVARHFRAS